MDYTELANQFLQKTRAFRNTHHQKMINETMQGEMFALIYAAQNGGSVLPGEISNHMNISSARVAAALNSLEKKGLLTRQVDVTDRRKVIVSLTPEGKELADRHRQRALGQTVHMLELLGEQDAKELVRIMGKLADFASQIIVS